MLHILLCGCHGKMGKMVMEMVAERSDMTLIGVDAVPGKGDMFFPVFQSFEEINIHSDVIIDFSHHSLMMPLLDYAERTKIPAVICTTGLNDEIHARMEEVAQRVPILHSGNMSLGIHILLKLVQNAASLLHEAFDIEIVERYHDKKADSPSGTAFMIANAINEELDQSKTFVYGRHGKDMLRQKTELGIHSVRGGTIVGEHSVIFAGPDELIEVNHRANSRRVFAVGAIKAAEFLIRQKPGMYTMDEVCACCF